MLPPSTAASASSSSSNGSAAQNSATQAQPSAPPLRKSCQFCRKRKIVSFAIRGITIAAQAKPTVSVSRPYAPQSNIDSNVALPLYSAASRRTGRGSGEILSECMSAVCCALHVPPREVRQAIRANSDSRGHGSTSCCSTGSNKPKPIYCMYHLAEGKYSVQKVAPFDAHSTSSRSHILSLPRTHASLPLPVRLEAARSTTSTSSPMYCDL